MIRRCTQPGRVKRVADIPAALEKWEQDLQQLSREYDEKISEGLMTGILLDMVPAAVTDFMTQRMGEEDSYPDTKETILRYVENKADLAVPMELDVLPDTSPVVGVSRDAPQGMEEGEDLDGLYKGRKGGAGKGGQKGMFNGTCNQCGAWGHKAADCPQAPAK